MADFQPGEMVRLKSGGPRMTIDDIGDYSPMGVGGEPHKAKCSWFDEKNKRMTDLFALHTLEKIEDRPTSSLRISRG